MRIYLAGKMDQLGEWRDGLLTKPKLPGDSLWHIDWPDDPPWDTSDYTASVVHWPEGPNTHVLSTHEYTGPYRSRLFRTDWEWKGSAHGNEGAGQHGLIESEADKERIVTLCEMGVRRCDLLFAYINTFDAFGTYAEIGMARALGKYVVVVERDDACGGYGDDLWFVGATAHRHALYRSTEGWGENHRVKTPDEERTFLRTVLLEEISRCSVRLAQAERRKAATRQTWERATGSFRQILRWTSDPRVRDEARKMIRYLDPTGESAAD